MCELRYQTLFVFFMKLNFQIWAILHQGRVWAVSLSWDISVAFKIPWSRTTQPVEAHQGLEGSPHWRSRIHCNCCAVEHFFELLKFLKLLAHDIHRPFSRSEASGQELIKDSVLNPDAAVLVSTAVVALGKSCGKTNWITAGQKLAIARKPGILCSCNSRNLMTRKFQLFATAYLRLMFNQFAKCSCARMHKTVTFSWCFSTGRFSNFFGPFWLGQPHRQAAAPRSPKKLLTPTYWRRTPGWRPLYCQVLCRQVSVCQASPGADPWRESSPYVIRSHFPCLHQRQGDLMPTDPPHAGAKAVGEICLPASSLQLEVGKSNKESSSLRFCMVPNGNMKSGNGFSLSLSLNWSWITRLMLAKNWHVLWA